MAPGPFTVELCSDLSLRVQSEPSLNLLHLAVIGFGSVFFCIPTDRQARTRRHAEKTRLQAAPPHNSTSPPLSTVYLSRLSDFAWLLCAFLGGCNLLHDGNRRAGEGGRVEKSFEALRRHAVCWRRSKRLHVRRCYSCMCSGDQYKGKGPPLLRGLLLFALLTSL